MTQSVFLFKFYLIYSYFNFVSVVRSEDALLYSLKHCTRTLDIEETPCLTACPATYKRERKFNDEVSISGKSLFLRNFYPSDDEGPYEIKLDICNTSFEPVTVYDSKHDKYQIGYELYYWHKEKEDMEIRSIHQNYYDQYRAVNMTQNIRDKVTHFMKPPNDLFIKYVDGPNTKFNLADGSQTLVFHWIPVFSVDYSRYKRRVRLTYNAHLNEEFQPDLNSTIPTCDDFNLEDEDMTDLFSEENQEKCLKDIVTETFEDKTSSQNMACGQSYGCLEKSQIIPLWYFSSRSTQLASCKLMNIMPVWKTIAEGQLRKVDQYILAILNTWREDLKIDKDHTFGEIIYGTWSALKLPTKNNPYKPQEMYLSNTERNQVVTIPKIIYRIVSVWWRGVAIIIHNDLSRIDDKQRICTKEEYVKGWENITNEDSTIGLTYTCPLTKEVDYRLGINAFTSHFGLELHGSPDQSKILLKDYRKISAK
ncbi:uncharacterized protein LOC135844372 [Planococcus citri]|uniref:uncharacterized protein LOC135844372 n=1 Tax=Planococcus citri TaxID=170843 RepID=UPI0031F99042